MSADKQEKPKVDLGLLEEDDEFEEFPAEGKNVREFLLSLYDHFIDISVAPVKWLLRFLQHTKCYLIKLLFLWEIKLNYLKFCLEPRQCHYANPRESFMNNLAI